MNKLKDKLKNCFGITLRNAFLQADDNIIDECEEIRIRLNRPVTFKTFGGEKYLKTDGGKNYIVSKKDIIEILQLVSDYSSYSFSEEMKNGFITIEGGFRIGLCGTAVVEKGEISGIKSINSMNIRICREVFGCGNETANKICENGEIKNTIILSPPSCGKTTLLRDIIRSLSNRGINIGVVDERSEISATFMGISANDLGTHTDVYNACPKEKGIFMLLRSMSPQIICVDEINGFEECSALEKAVGSGVNIICTAHAKNIYDMQKRRDLKQISHIFDIAVVLSRKNGAGTIEKTEFLGSH
jgi:stage III sporulation protein AA